MRPDPKSNLYYSYLLRVWRVNSQPPRWQVSLRDARTGESFNFAGFTAAEKFFGSKDR